MASNAKIVTIFNELAKIYNAIGERFRAIAYRNAARTIINLKSEIKDIESIGKLPGIGKGIHEKIAEILKTGKLKLLDDLYKKKAVKAYKELYAVLGISHAYVKKLLNQKIYSIKDLKQAVKAGKIELTHTQALGIKYYKDLNEKVPRSECSKIGTLLKSVIAKLYGKKVEFTQVGSYRRGLDKSGDIDILLTNKDENIDSTLLTTLLAELEKKDYFLGYMSVGETKFNFIIRSPYSQKVRQVDIRYVPRSSHYAALLYFTGSAAFNEILRKKFKKAGYLLNEYGVYKLGPLKKKTVIKVNSEKEIFDVLGQKYLPPNQRSF